MYKGAHDNLSKSSQEICSSCFLKSDRESFEEALNALSCLLFRKLAMSCKFLVYQKQDMCKCHPSPQCLHTLSHSMPIYHIKLKLRRVRNDLD